MSETTLLGIALIILIGFLAAIGYEITLVNMLITAFVGLIAIKAKDAKERNTTKKDKENNE